MRCFPTPPIFLRNVTDDEWIPSRAGLSDTLAESLYILVPFAILLLLAVVPVGLQQVSWDTCLDVYGPASSTSESTHPPREEDRRPSATHAAKAWAVKSLKSSSSFLLLFVSAVWQLLTSRDRSIPDARTPQTMWLRLFFLAAAVTYATLSLNYGGDGLFSMLLSCITHMMDVVALVFGDTQLSIETWG